MGDEHDSLREYMYFELAAPDGSDVLGVGPRLFILPESLKEDQRARMPLHFGRQVACALLDCMNRVDWKSCITPKEVEERLAGDFKQDYKTFEPQLA
jgi:hypothetical protein